MSKADARLILIGLVPDGVETRKLSKKAKAEIRAAIETVLRLVEPQ